MTLLFSLEMTGISGNTMSFCCVFVRLVLLLIRIEATLV